MIKVFFSTDEEGNVKDYTVGNKAIIKEAGFQLMVPSEQAEQIDKFELCFDNNKPKLRLKEGETFFEVEETEEEKEIRELEERLNELKNKE